MEYLILLYTQPEAWESKSETEMHGVLEEHGKLIADLQAAGKFRGGNALEWGAAATTVRVRNGQSLVTDGPFAETKEQLGGYYHVEADDLDRSGGALGGPQGARERALVHEWERGSVSPLP